MKAYFKQKTLLFKRPSGTSRGILQEKKSWFIFLQKNGKTGVGECGPLKGLSIDDRPDFAEKITEVCSNIQTFKGNSATLLAEWPSIRFGLECALMDLQSPADQILFPSPFTEGREGIPINGLIWMGESSFMKEQIQALLNKGFHCLKMKIGAIDFKEEIRILSQLRSEFSASELILRVDANGAFNPNNALEKLKRLSDLELHSIEQPIKAGQLEKMAELCNTSPLDIALDEELIPISGHAEKENLLMVIKPQFIILKPSLVGGFRSSNEWISIAEKNKTAWWITSALESNLGLNAISQWTYSKNAKGYQGLGTGSLYTNNIQSPLEIVNEKLFYNPNRKWALNEL